MHRTARMRRFVILTLVFTASAARAQAPAPDSTAAPAAPPAPDPATPPPPAPSPTIAKPAPDAPPQKVKEAKEVAAKAELTPIIPSPKNPTRPAFQLYAELDPPIVSVGLVYILARRVKQEPPAYCAPSCDSVDINRLDKLTAGYYSAGWSRASDVGLAAIGVGSYAMLVADEGLLPSLNDAVVIGEATLSAEAVATVMTLAAGRPRPFLYGDAAPVSVRNSSDASLSFLSSHAANAFAIVSSMYVAERRLHPHSSHSAWVLGVGLPIASAVAVSRVMAGYHFISDVVGGAVVGSSMGLLVTSVHRSPVKVVPVVNQDTAGKVSGGGLGLSWER